MKILPSPDSQLAAAADHGEMDAVVTWKPADSLTPVQIGNQVERIVKRLGKLADD
jgi:hypothetical protein